MAGDWIKFETTTPDKQEVHDIAATLNLDPDAVVGKLMRVWRWFDGHTKNGDASVTVSALLNREVGVEGFIDAMVNVGWILRSGKSITLSKFERHNGKTAKERALSAKRNVKYRDAKSDASVTVSASPREENIKGSTTPTFRTCL
jgi:hypothetical protein